MGPRFGYNGGGQPDTRGKRRSVMNNERWDQKIFKLPENHGWTAQPGNKVVVADRGALRFEIPQSWVVAPSSKSLKLLDGEPPNDDMSLEVSVFYAGQGLNVDWSGLPLAGLIKDVTADERDGISRPRRGKKRKSEKSKTGAPIAIKIGDLEMAWVQTEFIDKIEKRPAFSRQAITRHTKESIHGLLTLSFWPEDTERATAVWNDVLGSLKMGEHFEHPFFGPDRLR